MTIKEFIEISTYTVYVMTPWPTGGEYHPRTKKTYISSMDREDDISNREIDFFEIDFNEELEEYTITLYTK
jgi:hypothetical protein